MKDIRLAWETAATSGVPMPAASRSCVCRMPSSKEEGKLDWSAIELATAESAGIPLCLKGTATNHGAPRSLPSSSLVLPGMHDRLFGLVIASLLFDLHSNPFSLAVRHPDGVLADSAASDASRLDVAVGGKRAGRCGFLCLCQRDRLGRRRGQTVRTTLGIGGSTLRGVVWRHLFWRLFARDGQAPDAFRLALGARGCFWGSVYSAALSPDPVFSFERPPKLPWPEPGFAWRRSAVRTERMFFHPCSSTTMCLQTVAYALGCRFM